MISSVSLLRTAFLLLLITNFVAVLVRGNFLREGFSSKVGADARAKMKLDDAGAANGLSREMFLMRDKQWEIQPADFSPVKNRTLRRHCVRYLNKPVRMKLSGKRGKYGLKAQGTLPNGKRLRAFWREAPPTSEGIDFLKNKYDDAVRRRLTTIEFEVQLPPTDKKSKVLPSVIYSVAVEAGSMNPKIMVPRGSGSVRILPKGHVDGGKALSLEVGKAFVTVPMRNGVVDHGWARGRTIFRKGRTVGIV
jgi:hypothetical protein